MLTITDPPAEIQAEATPQLVEVDALTLRYHGQTRTLLVEPHPLKPGRHRISIVDETGQRHGLYWTVYFPPGSHQYNSEIGMVVSIIMDAIVDDTEAR